MQSLTTNALWNISGRVASLAIGFIITPVLVMHLGSSQYGLYMLIMSVTGIMGLMSFGLGEATLRYVAFYHCKNDVKGVNRVVGATLTIYLITGTSTVFLTVIVAPLVISLFNISTSQQGTAVLLLRLTSVSFLFSLLGSAIAAIPQGFQRYDVGIKISVIVLVLQSASIFFCVYKGYGIVELLILTIAANILNLLLNVLIVKYLWRAIRVIPSFTLLGFREVFAYGIFSFVTQVMGIGFNYSDRLLAGAFIDSQSVGYLTVPQDLAFRALSLVSQGGAVLFARFSSTEDQTTQFQLYIHSTWSMLLVSALIFVPLTVFIRDFIALWINPEFASNCSKVGELIAFSSIIRGAFVIYESFFRGIAKPYFLSMLSFCVGVTSLSLNLYLIPKYGLTGAGISYCVTALYGIAVILLVWRYLFRSRNYAILARILLFPVATSVGCVALGFALKQLWYPRSWIILACEILLVMFVTGVAIIGCEVVAGRSQNFARVFLSGLRGSLLVIFSRA